MLKFIKNQNIQTSYVESNNELAINTSLKVYQKLLGISSIYLVSLPVHKILCKKINSVHNIARVDNRLDTSGVCPAGGAGANVEPKTRNKQYPFVFVILKTGINLTFKHQF